MRNSIALALFLTALSSPLHSQASPYVPTDSWMMPFVEQLIRSGVIADPAPLSRPLRAADILAAIRGAESNGVPAAVRETMLRIERELTPISTHQWIIEPYAGATGGTHGRRNPLREAGPGSVSPLVGVRGSATFGAVVASSNIYANQRLDDDPDYTGNKDKWLTHRFTDAYVSLQFDFGEAFFGSIDRNWGPSGIPGSLVSSNPYSYDHAMIRIGTKRISIQTLLTDLDSFQDPTGVQVQRWWVTHRVVLRPWDALVVSLNQATLWTGVGRGLELRWLNPLKLSRSTALDEVSPDSSNSLYGMDIWLSLPAGFKLQANFTVDDFGFQFGSGAPDRVIGSTTVEFAASEAVSARGSFAFASSLAYRTLIGPQQAIMRRGIGLGRNYSDFIEMSADASVLLAPAIVLTPQLTLLKQGEGDFRLPFPPTPAVGHPFIFEGIVENTWRAGLTASASPSRHVDFAGHAGIHFVQNSGHIAGAKRTVFVGGFTIRIRFDKHGPL